MTCIYRRNKSVAINHIQLVMMCFHLVAMVIVDAHFILKLAMNGKNAEFFSLATMETGQVTSGQQMTYAHNNGCVTCLTSATLGVSLSGSDDNSVTLYDFYNGKKLQTWTDHQQAVTRVAYGHKLGLVVSASRDRKIILRRVAASSDHGGWTTDAHGLPITGLDISPDNKTICSGSRDNAVKLWDSGTGQLLSSCSVPRNLVTHMRWARASDLVVQTSEDKEVRLWDPRSRLAVIHSLNQKQYVQTHCDISADQNYVLTCSSGNNGIGCEATLWDLRGLRPLVEYAGHRQTVNSCIFMSEDPWASSTFPGPGLATASSDQTVRIWNQTTAESLAAEQLEGVGPLLDVHQFQDGSLGIATHRGGIRRYMRVRRHTGDWTMVLMSAF